MDNQLDATITAY